MSGWLMNGELRVELSEEDSDDARLDTLTRQFQRELLQLDDVGGVTATATAAAGPPPGAKSLDAAAVDALVVAAGTAAQGLAAVISLAQGWRGRGSRTRKVRLEIDGDVLVLEGEPDPTQDRLIAEFMKRRAKPKSRR
jgi:hypothetical protein